jgi:hypothetical protein
MQIAGHGLIVDHHGHEQPSQIAVRHRQFRRRGARRLQLPGQRGLAIADLTLHRALHRREIRQDDWLKRRCSRPFLRVAGYRAFLPSRTASTERDHTRKPRDSDMARCHLPAPSVSVV